MLGFYFFITVFFLFSWMLFPGFSQIYAGWFFLKASKATSVPLWVSFAIPVKALVRHFPPYDVQSPLLSTIRQTFSIRFKRNV